LELDDRWDEPLISSVARMAGLGLSATGIAGARD